MNIAQLRCISCNARFPPTDVLYRCATCGDLLDVVYDFPALDPMELKRLWQQRLMSRQPQDISGVWRFREMIPFFNGEQQIVTYPEGNTPLLEAPRCATYTGLRRLQVKHQGANPTGSFKDNGMCTGVTQARVLGMDAVLCASTGNTSASLAAYAARAGMLGIVLIPDGQIAFGKLAQALDYGALTLQVAGTFDTIQRLVLEVARDANVYVLNSVNPFRLEGQKTIMLELLQQRDWRVPDRIVVPGGNLGNSASFGKALKELYDLGFIDRLPKITIVQAQGANPLYRTMTSPEPTKLVTVHAKTLATAIQIGQPVSWRKAQRAMDWTNGWVLDVDEQAIADAKAIIGRDGIGCEPAAAATVAGIKKLLEIGTDVAVDPDEDVVAVLTGHVLKDPEYTVRYHRQELYEDFVVESSVTQKNGRLTCTYANQPVRVAADKDEIISAIARFRASATLPTTSA